MVTKKKSVPVIFEPPCTTFQDVTNFFFVQSVTFNVKHIEMYFIWKVRINVREKPKLMQ